MRNFPDIKKYILCVFALLFSFWGLSLLEVILKVSPFSLSNICLESIQKMYYDSYFSLVVGILCLPVFMFFAYIYKNMGLWLIRCLFILLLLIQIILIKYSFITYLNLGSDILGYSWEAIIMTVKPMISDYLILYILLFIIPILLFLGLECLLKRRGLKKIAIVTSILTLSFFVLKEITVTTNDSIHQNKLQYLIYDIIRHKKEKKQLKNSSQNFEKEYPYLRKSNLSNDVLSPFFYKKNNKPNIVILVIEGMGSEFNNGNRFSGFTPFIDSLISKSLYWKNFVCTSGRSFGTFPSLLASLPYGDKGFLDIEKTPNHISLISILKENNYSTSFFAGHDSNFDRLSNFLIYNGIDNIIDRKSYNLDYPQTKESSTEFSWGYPDDAILKKVIASLDDIKTPRFDVIKTQTIHEPFNFPTRKTYLKKIDSLLEFIEKDSYKKEVVKNHKNIFSTLLYTDDAIKNYMKVYSQRSDFENTIFIITGDHRLIPINQEDRLCVYHVPLIIYSPLLKKEKTFASISSHLDLTPSLISFLTNNYAFKSPAKVSWLGTNLDTTSTFRNINQIPLIRYKGKIGDYIYKDYLYSDKVLYKIKEDFSIYKTRDSKIQKIIEDSLNSFKKTNLYVTQKNKIYPQTLSTDASLILGFSATEMNIIKSFSNDLNSDILFMKAKELAFMKDYKKAQLLCNYILKKHFNHCDAQTLKGRMYAWERKYKEAEEEFLSTIKKSPFCSDTYIALLDMYYWSGQDKKTIDIEKIVLKRKIDDSDIFFKIARAYYNLKKPTKAATIIDSLIKIHPQNKEYLTFKKSLYK